MSSLFPLILFGHLVGDYFLQPNFIALNKGRNTLLCLLHCAIYTICVTLFTMFAFDWNNEIWPLFIFVSHFIVDRWSLGDKWLRFVGGSSVTDYVNNPLPPTFGLPEMNQLTTENFHKLRGGFTAVVYVAVDNGIHLMTMYFFALHFLIAVS